MTRFLFIVTPLALAASFCVGAVPPPDKLLPQDTLVMFTIPSVDESRKTTSNWPSVQLWQDPAMKAFRDKFTSKLKEKVIAPLEREFGVKLSDYTGLAQGQLTFAVSFDVAGAEAGTLPAFVLLMDTGDKAEQLEKNLNEVRNRWTDSGRPIRRQTLRDVQFSTFIFTKADLKNVLKKVFADEEEGAEEQESDEKIECIVGQSDSLLIVGNSVSAIEKILIRQAGGGVASLSEQASFAAGYTSMFRDAESYGWVNVKAILDLFMKTIAKEQSDQSEQPFAMPRPDAVFNALGLTGLESVAFGVRELSGGWLTEMQVRVPPSQRRGLFKLLSFESKDAAPPSFVPADSVEFLRWRVDLAKAFSAFENMLSEVSPHLAGVFKLLVENAGKDKDPNFDLRENLIGNLGDDIISYKKAPREMTLAGLTSPPTVTLVSSPRPEQLAAALKAVGSLMPARGGKVKEREFLGRTIYTMPLPAAGLQGEASANRELNFAASGGYTALSADVSALEEYLRAGSSSSGRILRETPGLMEAAEKVGGMGTGLFGFEDQRATMRATVETLKKESGALATLFQGAPFGNRIGGETGFLKEWLDFSLLPDYERIAKYFHIVVWSGTTTSEGLSFKLFSPDPPHL